MVGDAGALIRRVGRAFETTRRDRSCHVADLVSEAIEVAVLYDAGMLRALVGALASEIRRTGVGRNE